MKKNFYVMVCLSSLLLIPPSSAWSSTALTPTPSTPISTTSTTNNIRQIAQSITVKILVKDTAGSGFIISKKDNIYTVITNAHVVNRGEPYQIQTPDGKIYQAILKSKEDSQSGNDLALLKFSSNISYAVAQIDNVANLAENQEVYAAGYPYDSQTLAFSGGKISLISEKPLKGGYQIGYTNTTVQGMSGGVLLNSEGKVIGILGMGSQAILDDAYTYTDNTRPDEQTLAKLQQAGFAVPVKSFYGDEVADNSPVKAYTGIAAEDVKQNNKGWIFVSGFPAVTAKKFELNIGQSLGVPIGTFIGRATQANIQEEWLTIEKSKPSAITEADINTIRTQLFTLKALSSDSNAYEWLNYCNNLWRSFQFNEAVAACDRAIAKKTDFYQAYYLKGLSLFNKFA